MPLPFSRAFTVLLVEHMSVPSLKVDIATLHEPDLTILGCVHDLTNAYRMTEEHQPDLVIVSERFLGQTDFPMYAAMLDMLGVQHCILADKSTTDSLGKSIDRASITAAGGFGPFLRQRFKIDGKPPVSGLPQAQLLYNQAAWRPVVMGASTGGIEALLAVLSHYPAMCPPTLIVQHINGGFLPGLAQRLNRHCAAEVAPATCGAELAPGHVYLAPGNAEHLLVTPFGKRCRLRVAPPESGHRPSVDALFKSALHLAPDLVAVLLTGMGRDGAEGMANIKAAGGWTIAQDRQTCAVYGMPRAAHEVGGVCETLPLRTIGPAVLRAANTSEKALSRVNL